MMSLQAGVWCSTRGPQPSSPFSWAKSACKTGDVCVWAYLALRSLTYVARDREVVYFSAAFLVWQPSTGWGAPALQQTPGAVSLGLHRAIWQGSERRRRIWRSWRNPCGSQDARCTQSPENMPVSIFTCALPPKTPRCPRRSGPSCLCSPGCLLFYVCDGRSSWQCGGRAGAV